MTLTATGEDQIQLATRAALPLLARARAAAAAARVARRAADRDPEADARRVPARPVAGLRQVGCDRRVAARAAQPAPLPLGAVGRRARAAGGRGLRLARRGLHDPRPGARRGPGARLREPARARLPARERLPDGEAGRLPPLRGARQEPGRRARRRAAGAGRGPVRAGRAALPRGPRRRALARGEGPHAHAEGSRPRAAHAAPARRGLRRRLPGAGRRSAWAASSSTATSRAARASRSRAPRSTRRSRRCARPSGVEIGATGAVRRVGASRPAGARARRATAARPRASP